MGRGVLSTLSVTRGIAGYEAGIYCDIFHVRRRVFLAALGQWGQADPAEHGYPASRLAYCGGMPVVLVDPYGLQESIAKGWEEFKKYPAVRDVAARNPGASVAIGLVYRWGEGDQYPDAGIRNAMGHCVNACLMSKEVGESVASEFLEAKEVDDQARAREAGSEEDLWDSEVDKLNNRAGLKCARGDVAAPDVSRVEHCRRCCRRMHLWGELFTSTDYGDGYGINATRGDSEDEVAAGVRVLRIGIAEDERVRRENAELLRAMQMPWSLNWQ